MSINPTLLVASDVLQQYLVDKDTGFPLANGQITLYQDTNRSILKNWYYQTGVPGAYSYIALDNPLYLSSVGTIQDPNGNDVIPFYYPWDDSNPPASQKYYVTVYSTDENSFPTILQFTRENWPPDNGESGPPETKGNTLRNYIINNVFWRNSGYNPPWTNALSLNATDVLNAVVAPSQHDGYNQDPLVGQSDIRFIKNKVGATDQVQFLPMDGATLGNGSATGPSDIAPETYLNVTCSASTTGEEVKCIQYPVSLHLDTLSGVDATLVVWARNSGASPNATLSFYAYPYLGTGSASGDFPILTSCIPLGEMTLNSSSTFQQGIFSVDFTSSATTSVTGDDAWYILVCFPTNTTFSIDHTKMQLYMGNAYADNDFDTYDQINSIICSERTGDIRTSLNDWAPWGYLPMNDGTIGDKDSNATTRTNDDCWQLYNLIWNQMHNNQTYAPMYSSAGASVAYGASAYLDWTANNQISLLKSLGRVLAGSSQFIPDPQFFTTNHASSNSILTITGVNASQFGTGTPVILSVTLGSTLPTGLSSSTVYYSKYLTSTTMQITLQPFDGSPVTFSDNGSGTFKIAIYSATIGTAVGETSHVQSLAELAAHTHAPLSPAAFFQGQGTGGSFQTTTSAGSTSPEVATTAIAGSSTASNIMQPTTFMNVFIKM